MVDGILDLLAAILVLGIVLAVAFGFILPLNQEDVMQYNTRLEDKALMNNIVDYSEDFSEKDITKRKYSFEELILLMYVQDDRMTEPKAVNMRNLISDNVALEGRNNSNYINWDFNAQTPPMADINVLNTIRYYSDNPSDPNNLIPAKGNNIGTIKIGANYAQINTSIANLLTKSNKVHGFNFILDKDNSNFYKENNGNMLNELDSSVKKNNLYSYTVDYVFAIPDFKDVEYTAENQKNRNFDDIPVYVINKLTVDRNNSPVVDSFKYNLDYIKSLQQLIH